MDLTALNPMMGLLKGTFALGYTMRYNRHRWAKYSIEPAGNTYTDIRCCIALYAQRVFYKALPTQKSAKDGGKGR